MTATEFWVQSLAVSGFIVVPIWLFGDKTFNFLERIGVSVLVLLGWAALFRLWIWFVEAAHWFIWWAGT